MAGPKGNGLNGRPNKHVWLCRQILKPSNHKTRLMKKQSAKSRTAAAAPPRPETALDIRRRGQVFTPEGIVLEMLALRQNKGSVLEPACGEGAFLKKLRQSDPPENILGLELDARLPAGGRVWRRDFFAFPLKNQFDTVIGNPPYVRHQDILPQTKRLLPRFCPAGWFDRRSNLYLFFIAKSISHLRPGGELIFITPRDFLKAASARRLNSELFRQGSFTHYRELGDLPVFRGYAPSCAIWRWEKGRFDRRLSGGKLWLHHSGGQLWFGRRSKPRRLLSDLFDVKVGAVSGADHIFTDERRGNADMVCSRTIATGKTRRMIYNQKNRALIPHKKELLRRRVRAFDENNWWEWGRRHCERPGPRVYVNCKTRNPQPFFTHKSSEYDGSVLALFPKNPDTDTERAAAILNAADWHELGFGCGGRLLFSQRSLHGAPAPAAL